MSDTNNKNSCSQKTCQSGQFGHPNTWTEEKNPDMSGRPVLYTGVLWIGILRRFLIPRPVTDTRPCCSRKARSSPEAKDVALITPTNTSSATYIQPSAHAHHKPQEFREQGHLSREKQENKHSPLANLVYQLQEASAVLKDEARQFSDDLSELVQDGKATTSETLHTLREDDGVAGRYGAITITSLLGYMAGMRRSVAVRLVYATTGAVATATLCYPEEARHCNKLALALFREGVLLSIQLLTHGPQKTLVVKDSAEQEIPTSRKNKKITSETHYKPKQQTEPSSKPNNDNATIQEKSFGESEHRKKQNHLSSISEQSTLQQNLIFLEEQEMPSKGPPSQFAAQERKLSRECQRNRTRDVPYSPALPVPPEIDPDYFQNSDTYNAYQNVPTTIPGDSLSTNLKENADLQPHTSTLHDSNSSLKVNTSHSEHKTSQHKITTNHTEPNDVISALEPIKEAVTDTSKNENRHKSQNYPLNKKLSRYYVEKKNDTLTSPEEHDDINLKSKRKEKHSN